MASLNSTVTIELSPESKRVLREMADALERALDHLTPPATTTTGEAQEMAETWPSTDDPYHTRRWHASLPPDYRGTEFRVYRDVLCVKHGSTPWLFTKAIGHGAITDADLPPDLSEEDPITVSVLSNPSTPDDPRSLEEVIADDVMDGVDEDRAEPATVQDLIDENERLRADLTREREAAEGGSLRGNPGADVDGDAVGPLEETGGVGHDGPRNSSPTPPRKAQVNQVRGGCLRPQFAFVGVPREGQPMTTEEDIRRLYAYPAFCSDRGPCRRLETRRREVRFLVTRCPFCNITLTNLRWYSPTTEHGEGVGERAREATEGDTTTTNPPSSPPSFSKETP